MADTERIIQLEQELSEVRADRDAWREAALNWQRMVASRREQLNRIEQLQNQIKEAAEATFGSLTGKAVEVTIPGETGALPRTMLLVDCPEAREWKAATETGESNDRR
jgi:hypothetical protein